MKMEQIDALSIAELKTYYDLIKDQLVDLDRRIYIQDGTKDVHERREQLFTIKTLINKEINKRITNLIQSTDGKDKG